MELKLFDSERKVMEVLWEADAPLTAKEIAVRLGEKVGWNKNTTYTVIKECIDKGAIERREPRECSHKGINHKCKVDKGQKDNVQFVIAGKNLITHKIREKAAEIS